MTPVDVEVAVVIARPVAEVAAFAGDPARAPEWYRNIRSVRRHDEGPVRLGSRVDFVASFLSRELAYTYEVVRLEPEERLVMRTTEGPFPMETIYNWAPVGLGTRMRLRNTGEPQGLAALATPLVSRAMRREMRKDLARLKALLEA